jgi:hypothetical protein
MGEEQQDKRRYPRVIVGGEAKGRVTFIDDALLLNISLGGVLIEHIPPLHPGTLTSLGVELQGKRVRLRCRVVRSVAHRIGLQPDGERALIYHTGLEFLDPSDEARQVISQYIHSMSEDGSESGTREREWQEYLVAELEKLEQCLGEARRKLAESTSPPYGAE